VPRAPVDNADPLISEHLLESTARDKQKIDVGKLTDGPMSIRNWKHSRIENEKGGPARK